MAEAVVSRGLEGQVETCSAGTAPGRVHPLSMEVLSEIGIDISSARSKHIDEFRGQEFDLVVTLCDQAAGACPVWPGQGRRIHVGFQDPASVPIDDEEKRIEPFRQVRDRMVEQLVPRIREELGL